MNIFKNRKHKALDVLVLGNDGMLGSVVYARLLDMQRYNGINSVSGLTFDELQKKFNGRIDNFFAASRHFEWVINCFAYTNVAKAQTMPGWEDSYRGNATLPHDIAMLCKSYGSKLLHISTDYVMSADSEDAYPFDTFEKPNPINAYGIHKLVGEMNIEKTMQFRQYCILRTSWLYGMHGEKSFIHKLLDATAKAYASKTKTLTFTTCEHSIPTSVDTVWEYINDTIFLKCSEWQIRHAVCDIETTAIPSRYDYAVAIRKYLEDAIEDIAGDDSPIQIDSAYQSLKDAFGEVSIISTDEPYTKDGVSRPIMSALKASSCGGETFPWDSTLNAFIKDNIDCLIRYFNRRLEFYNAANSGDSMKKD